jgi:polyferredoxin
MFQIKKLYTGRRLYHCGKNDGSKKMIIGSRERLQKEWKRKGVVVLNFLKKYKISLIILFVFELIAVILWLSLNKIFYLINFTYIGISLTVGLALFTRGYKYARIIIQFFIGLYMLVYLGILSHENMQIEGFLYYIYIGIFEAALIHYVVAKIIGPLLFGRGWCGYACWTAMIFDLFPYKIPRNKRIKKLGLLRLFVFILSFALFLIIIHIDKNNLEYNMFFAFVIGNIVYYIVGTILAFILKDNRAFCKYICPITVFLKPASYFSFLRVKVDTDKCISCKKCIQICPMDVDILNNKRNRQYGTECILCMNCILECPKRAIKI